MKLHTAATSLLITSALATAQASWTQLTPVVSPTDRSAAKACSEIVSMLVFGGSTASGRSDELWRFDPLASGGPTWDMLTPAGTPPVARAGHGAAYDLGRGVLVVFGGRIGSGSAGVSGETWEWDSGTNTWTEKTPAVPMYGVNTPPHLDFPGMVFDSSSGRCLLFGGRGNGTSAPMEYAETWTWDGIAWSLVTPLTTSPPARRNHAMTHSIATGQTMVWGGIASGTALGDTWIWDGSDWSNVVTATTPYANGTHNGSLLNGLVYDGARQRFVLTWGTYPGGLNLTETETYEFDGVDWTNRGPSGVVKSYQGSIAYLEGIGKTYRFGGYNLGQQDQTWEYQTANFASAISYGSGCAGQSGSNLALVAGNDPWTGDTWTGTCATMGGASFALGIFGVATASLPLDVALPGFGQPGCVLLNSADALLGPSLPVAGSVDITLPLPSTVTLAGSQIHAQVAELDFAVANLWTSNGITLTIGVR